MDLQKLEQELQKPALSEKQARELREAMIAFGRRMQDETMRLTAAFDAMGARLERETQAIRERIDTQDDA